MANRDSYLVKAKKIIERLNLIPEKKGALGLYAKHFISIEALCDGDCNKYAQIEQLIEKPFEKFEDRFPKLAESAKSNADYLKLIFIYFFYRHKLSSKKNLYLKSKKLRPRPCIGKPEIKILIPLTNLLVNIIENRGNRANKSNQEFAQNELIAINEIFYPYIEALRESHPRFADWEKIFKEKKSKAIIIKSQELLRFTRSFLLLSLEFIITNKYGTLLIAKDNQDYGHLIHESLLKVSDLGAYDDPSRVYESVCRYVRDHVISSSSLGPLFQVCMYDTPRLKEIVIKRLEDFKKSFYELCIEDGFASTVYIEYGDQIIEIIGEDVLGDVYEQLRNEKRLNASFDNLSRLLKKEELSIREKIKKVLAGNIETDKKKDGLDRIFDPRIDIFEFLALIPDINEPIFVEWAAGRLMDAYSQNKALKKIHTKDEILLYLTSKLAESNEAKKELSLQLNDSRERQLIENKKMESWVDCCKQLELQNNALTEDFKRIEARIKILEDSHASELASLRSTFREEKNRQKEDFGHAMVLRVLKLVDLLQIEFYKNGVVNGQGLLQSIDRQLEQQGTFAVSQINDGVLFDALLHDPVEKESLTKYLNQQVRVLERGYRNHSGTIIKKAIVERIL